MIQQKRHFLTTKLLVIDLSNFIYRAFYATEPLTAPDGTPVNATYGLMKMLNQLLTKYKPTHVLIAKDSASVDSIRVELFPEYKGTRSSPPDNLSPQFPLIREMLEGLELVQVCISRYEADDVIGSVATQWKDKFDEILIATGDKDMLQFVGGNVKVIDTMKNIEYGREEVKTKMGVYPEHVVDYLSLVGDTSDNIPGVAGIGPKGAIALIEEYGSLSNILGNVSGIKSGRNRACLEKHSDTAIFSKNLATIRTELDLGVSPEDCKYQLHSTDKLTAFFDRLGFKSFKGRF
jgi:DNA polymerase-1